MHRQLLLNNRTVQSASNKSWWIGLFLCSILFFCFDGLVHSAPIKESTATLVEYLAQEKNHLTLAINDARQKTIPKNEQDYYEKIKQTSAILTMTGAKIGSLDGFLDNQIKQQNTLNQRLKHLQQLPITNGEMSLQERVAKVEISLADNRKTIELINENQDLAKEFKSLLANEINELQLWKAKFDLEQKLIQIKTTKNKLNHKLGILYQNNMDKSVSRNRGKKNLSPLEYEARLFVTNQNITLIHQMLNNLNIQQNVIRANIVLLQTTDTKTLQYVTDTYKESINQYIHVEKTLLKTLDSLTNEDKILITPELKKSVKNLQSEIKTQLNETGVNKLALIKNLEEYQNQLKKLISSRQSLSEYSINSWPVILDKLLDIPNLSYKYIKMLSLKVYDSYSWFNTMPAVFLWAGLTFIVAVFYLFNRFLKLLSSDKERSRLTGYLYDGVLTLFQRNIPYLCLFTMLWVVLYVTNISYANYQLLFNLIAVWFTFRVLILIARLVLLERITDSSGKDVKLYYRLKWLLLFGGWTTALMVFSHILPLTLLLQDIFNRLFMLFLLAISLVAWKSKDVIPYLLRPFLKTKKRYFKNAISLLVVLIPITLFTTAIIGLLGYVNLAWTMSRYQAYMLIILVGYILVRGLIFDALELLSEWMISSLKNGWLWIEVFLKPLDGILRVFLFLLSMFLLFQLYGWHSDSLVMVSMEQIAKYSIVNFTGIHITVSSVIEFFILVAIFVWAAKWTREFGYRWLFRNVKDVGIRNSLSVFTQYAIVLLGAFITLHVLGIDFSGMSMILGGLAVGMGFGLRDFASNIVGGIMLLIERPVREGDLITIGEYEGQVAHIGIRSMRVSSWDNTQVLIPNAETFNKPFTNWTHQDGIVRTVIPIKVSRADDPVMIQQLILDVLAIIPEIATDPPAQVFLKKIDTALIEFEARYFINVQDHNRVEIRSKVLFAITAQFKAAGIKPPIEPITVEFKEGHGDFHVNKNQSTSD